MLQRFLYNHIRGVMPPHRTPGSTVYHVLDQLSLELFQTI